MPGGLQTAQVASSVPEGSPHLLLSSSWGRGWRRGPAQTVGELPRRTRVTCLCLQDAIHSDRAVQASGSPVSDGLVS